MSILLSQYHIDNVDYNIAILFAIIDDIDFCGKCSDVRKLNAITAPGEFGEFLSVREPTRIQLVICIFGEC